MSTPITICIASDSEREDAYRLRYECFTQENGDERFAHHEQKMYMDKWDNSASTVVVAKNCSDKIIGTVRYISRAKMEFPSDHIYDYDRYAEILRLPRDRVQGKVALLGRGAVPREYRRLGLYTRMMSFCESLSLQSGILLHVGLAATANYTMPKALLSAGWERLPKLVINGEWQGYCFYKVL